MAASKSYALAFLAAPVSKNLSSSTSTVERKHATETTASVWEARTAARVGTLRGSGSGVGGSGTSIGGATRIGTSNTFLASRAGKSTIVSFVFGRETTIGRFASPEQIGPLASSTNGDLIAAGGVSGSIYIWEAATGCLLSTWKAHYRSILSVVFSRDDAFLVTGGDDALIHAWSVADVCANSASSSISGHRRPLKTASHHKLGVTGLAVGPGVGLQTVYASCSSDHTVGVFTFEDSESARVRPTIASFGSALCSVAFSSSEEYVYAGSADGFVHRLDPRTLERTLLEYGGGKHDGPVRCLLPLESDLSTDEDLLLTGAEDGSLHWFSGLRCVNRAKCEGGVRALVAIRASPSDLHAKDADPTLIPSSASEVASLSKYRGEGSIAQSRRVPVAVQLAAKVSTSVSISTGLPTEKRRTKESSQEPDVVDNKRLKRSLAELSAEWSHRALRSSD